MIKNVICHATGGLMAAGHAWLVFLKSSSVSADEPPLPLPITVWAAETPFPLPNQNTAIDAGFPVMRFSMLTFVLPPYLLLKLPTWLGCLLPLRVGCHCAAISGTLTASELHGHTTRPEQNGHPAPLWRSLSARDLIEAVHSWG